MTPDKRHDDRSPSASPKENVVYLDSSTASNNPPKHSIVDPFAADGGATIKSGGMPLTAWQASAAELAKLLVGKHLGSFVIEEALGTGGMAAVFKANDPLLDRRVALKILPPVLATQPEQVQRFEREARVSAQLDHDHIARVHQYGQDQGLHYIAYEFVEGINLRDLMQQAGGKLTVPDAIKYLTQAAAGLAHASTRGVIHRDIKPSNLVINTQGNLKLVDLGLARNQLSVDSAALTHSGATLGTFDYLSPEQAIDPRRADVRSDIYSLGCTFYHAVTGVPPVPEGTAARKLQSHQQEQPVNPRLLNPEVPPALVTILSRMLAKKPEDRYQQADELLSDLQQLQSPGNIVPVLPKQPVPAEPRQPWYLPLLGIAILALGIFTWEALSGTPPRLADRDAIIAKYQSPSVDQPASTATNTAGNTPSDTPLRLEVDTTEELVAALKRPQGGVIYLKKPQYDVRSTPLLVSAGDWVLRPLGSTPVTFKLMETSEATLFEVKAGALHLVDLKLEVNGQDATGITVHPPAQFTSERCEFIRLAGSSIVVRNTTPAAFVKVTKASDATQTASLEFKGVVWHPSSSIGAWLEAPVYFQMEECWVAPQYQFIVMPSLAQSNQKRLVSIRQSAIAMPSDACFKVAGKQPVHLELERTLFSKISNTGSDEPVWLVMEEGTPVDLQCTETLFHRVNTYAAWQRPTATREIVAREWRQIRTALSRCRDESTAFTTRSPWLEMRPWQRYQETRNVTALALKSDYGTTGPSALLGQKLQLAATTKETTEPAAKKTRTLIVDGRGEEPGTYTTLSSAIGTITDEEETIIELHLHGTVAVKPMELGNSKIILKAGDGFQPELTFHRDTVAGPDGETQLFRLHDGELSLENVKVRMEPLRDTAKALSMLNITGMGKCRLKDAIVTLKGNSELTATVYTISEPAGNMPGVNKTLRAGAARLDCTDTLVRGTGQLLHVLTSRPFQLQLLQTGVALEGTMLLVEGNRSDMNMPSEPAQMQLDRCTCYASRGIVQLRATSIMPQLGGLRCIINQSILASSEMQPLVRVETQQSESDIKRKLQWQGRRNIYLSTSGTLLATQQLGEPMATLYDATLWSDFWGSDDEQAQMVKQVPLQGLLRQSPMAEWDSSDFGLREAGNLSVREMGLPMESMPKNQSP